jgi:hypothetical protein
VDGVEKDNSGIEKDENGGTDRGDFLGEVDRGVARDWSFSGHKDGGPHGHLAPPFTMREGSLLETA